MFLLPFVKGEVPIDLEKKSRPVVYIISDSSGETAELVVRAAASQFRGEFVDVRRVPYVNEIGDVSDVFTEAARCNSIIAFTLVLPRLRDEVVKEAQKHNITTVDIMSPMLDALTKIEKTPPRLEPGLVRRTDEDYFRRVEAIEFAVKHDDGNDPRGINWADLVVIGVSRTSKTPLCMLLAHKMMKAANIPLVPEVAPPEEIFRLPARKLIGLTIQPSYLLQIREERLKTIGLPAHADYASMERILKELDYAGEIMKKTGCQVIDVTNRAIEEIASKVMEIYYRGERNGK